MSARLFPSVVFFLVCCLASAQVSQYAEIPITPAESWTVQGRTVKVKATVITGAALFTIHAFVDHLPADNERDRGHAKEIARYAMENGYFRNALQYNKYSDDFYVKDGVVGVALIYQKENKMSGFRFAFTAEDFPDGFKIPDFPLPETLTAGERQSLRTSIERICDSRSFDQLYTLYSPDALKDIPDLDTSKKESKVQFSMAKEIDFPGEGFITYIGTKEGIRGYFYFIPIVVTPFSDTTKKLNLYFKATIVDTPEKYAIYGLELNFPKQDDFNAFMGKGDPVTSPVKPETK